MAFRMNAVRVGSLNILKYLLRVLLQGSCMLCGRVQNLPSTVPMQELPILRNGALSWLFRLEVRCQVDRISDVGGFREKEQGSPLPTKHQSLFHFQSRPIQSLIKREHIKF